MARIVKYHSDSEKKKLCRFIAAAVCFLSFFPCIFAAPQVVQAEDSVITVGYTDSYSVSADENGNVGGYVADYLSEIARYTGWEYEYVHGTWAELEQMLVQGELDLMGPVWRTEERQDYFLFSDLSMAHNYNILCAAPDSDFYYQDYDSFNGCRIGAVAETVYAENLLVYLKNRGLDCETVFYSARQEMLDALSLGEIDLLVTGILSDLNNLKPVDRFDLQPNYFVTGLQNSELMEELNSAMQQLRIETPDIESDLINKYYSTGVSAASLFLTKEEQAFIESSDPILVKGFSGRRPLGYTENDGRFTGVLVDYLDMVARISGLEFVHESTETLSLEENISLMEEENYALLFVDSAVSSLPPDSGVITSVPLFKTGLAYVKRSEDVGETGRDDYVFALIHEMNYLEELLYSESDRFTIRYYETSAECMDAVIAGNADMTIQDEHVVTYLLQKPRYADRLTRCEGGEYVDGMCLYAPADQQLLIRILDKTIQALGQENLSLFVADAMINHSYQYNFSDFMYEQRLPIVISVLMFIVTISLGVMLYNRISRLGAQAQENSKLQENLRMDDLTCAYNRKYFFQKAREIIDESDEDMYIVRLNICNFKIINELYGAEKGDRLLREIAEDLTRMGKEMDFIVGRFMADNFYLCIRKETFDNISFPKQSAAPWLGIEVSLSYGIYPVNQQKDLPLNIMCDRANMANMSKGNLSTDYIRFYSDEDLQQMLQEQEIENEMSQALAQRQFRIFIQPKFDVETEKIVGGEALVRWFHPEKGMIPPGKFIGLFERNGFIQQLDYYVWEECCRFLAEAKKKGLPTLPISTNVSRIHFYGSELQSRLTGLLEQYQLDAKDLELEITETMCAEDDNIVTDKCRELRKAGFQIAMDDFGSGYSSLNMLKELPIDIIKMDLGFLAGEDEGEQKKKGRSILRTLIELAHTLDLKIVIEGLETKEQNEFIREIGGCTAQGYYYSRPVECEIYENMLSGQSVARQ